MDQNYAVTVVFVDGPVFGDECYLYPKSDLDHNCRVDLNDLSLFVQQWMMCVSPECD